MKVLYGQTPYSLYKMLQKYSATKMLGGSKMQKTHTHVLIKITKIFNNVCKKVKNH